MVKKIGLSGCDAGPLKANSKQLPAHHSAFASAFQPQTEDQILHSSPPRTGGRKSRDRGNRTERALVRFFQNHGFAAECVPLSGSAGGSYLGDLALKLLCVDRVVEVKVRARGFAQLYDWLEGRDILIVKADRREPLAIVPLTLAVKIARAAERAKGGG